MKSLIRWLLIVSAYVVAMFAAISIFALAIYLAGSPLLGHGFPLAVANGLYFMIVIVVAVAVVFTSLPMLWALTFAELLGIQSILYFMAWGLVAAAGIWFWVEIVPLLDDPQPSAFLLSETGAFLGAGLAASIVYWLIAGRTSGDWGSQY